MNVFVTKVSNGILANAVILINVQIRTPVPILLYAIICVLGINANVLKDMNLPQERTSYILRSHKLVDELRGFLS